MVRDTRHYRKVVLTTIPSVGYLDERPVFPLERATTDAWAIGGREAEMKVRCPCLHKSAARRI
jgi:dynein assembly factor 1, axonemal